MIVVMDKKTPLWYYIGVCLWEEILNDDKTDESFTLALALVAK
jgi:hypothetical protein